MLNLVKTMSGAMIYLAGVGIILMLVLVVSDVVGRAVLNTAIPGIDTIVASYLMVATIFLPLGLLQVLDENISVDFLHNIMPKWMQGVFDVLAQLLAMLFFALLGWLYFWVAVEAYETKEYVTGTWDVPIWPARILMPLGLAVASFAAAVMLYRAVFALFSRSKPLSNSHSGRI
jgi:TRAP-type C4-dicarboxylate transport system permease small subunit